MHQGRLQIRHLQLSRSAKFKIPAKKSEPDAADREVRLGLRLEQRLRHCSLVRMVLVLQRLPKRTIKEETYPP